MDVSIIVGEIITNIMNLRDCVAYAKERGISIELVKNRNQAKGKYLFFYDTNLWYAKYYLHLCFIRLSMPVGDYQPDDVDLPEKIVFRKMLYYEDGKITASNNDHSDFTLRKPNGYKNEVVEHEIYGCCKRGTGGESILLGEELTKELIDFFSD